MVIIVLNPILSSFSLRSFSAYVITYYVILFLGSIFTSQFEPKTYNASHRARRSEYNKLMPIIDIVLRWKGAGAPRMSANRDKSDLASTGFEYGPSEMNVTVSYSMIAGAGFQIGSLDTWREVIMDFIYIHSPWASCMHNDRACE